MSLKLNLGAGKTPLPGYVNVDRKTGGEVYPLRVPRKAPATDFTVADACVDEVRASHVLEHLGHRDTLAAIQEWARVLKPGGVLKVAVPDFDKIVDAYRDGKQEWPIEGYLMGGQTDGDDQHRAIFNRQKLADLMGQAGLTDVREWRSEADDCAALPVSLNLMATKPAVPVAANRKPKVACAMSVPRLGFQDNFFCWASALLPLGIKPCKYDGAFWGQCLERVMEQLVEGEDPPDYILTVDYDTVFTRENVEELIRLAEANPHAGAVAALQCKRSDGLPLITVPGADGKPVDRVAVEDFQRDLLKVRTAHFGLTLIRVEALRKLPHPWFKGEPDERGRWGDGRVDDDIYFWFGWEKAGNAVYQANHVVVGHAQLLITWPDREMRPIHQRTSEFWDKGAPAEVWR